MQHNYKEIKVSHVMEDLIDKAWTQRLIYNPLRGGRSCFPASMEKPGALIEKLSEGERKKLVELTTKDFDHRPDEAVRFLGPCNPTGHTSRYTKGLQEARALEEKKNEERNKPKRWV
jgi:hypothetical protein